MGDNNQNKESPFTLVSNYLDYYKDEKSNSSWDKSPVCKRRRLNNSLEESNCDDTASMSILESNSTAESEAFGSKDPKIDSDENANTIKRFSEFLKNLSAIPKIPEYPQGCRPDNSGSSDNNSKPLTLSQEQFKKYECKPLHVKCINLHLPATGPERPQDLNVSITDEASAIPENSIADSERSVNLFQFNEAGRVNGSSAADSELPAIFNVSQSDQTDLIQEISVDNTERRSDLSIPLSDEAGSIHQNSIVDSEHHVNLNASQFNEAGRINRRSVADPELPAIFNVSHSDQTDLIQEISVDDTEHRLELSIPLSNEAGLIPENSIVDSEHHVNRNASQFYEAGLTNQSSVAGSELPVILNESQSDHNYLIKEMSVDNPEHPKNSSASRSNEAGLTHENSIVDSEHHVNPNASRFNEAELINQSSVAGPELPVILNESQSDHNYLIEEMSVDNSEHLENSSVSQPNEAGSTHGNSIAAAELPDILNLSPHDKTDLIREISIGDSEHPEDLSVSKSDEASSTCENSFADPELPEDLSPRVRHEIGSIREQPKPLTFSQEQFQKHGCKQFEVKLIKRKSGDKTTMIKIEDDKENINPNATSTPRRSGNNQVFYENNHDYVVNNTTYIDYEFLESSGEDRDSENINTNLCHVLIKLEKLDDVAKNAKSLETVGIKPKEIINVSIDMKTAEPKNKTITIQPVGITEAPMNLSIKSEDHENSNSKLNITNEKIIDLSINKNTENPGTSNSIIDFDIDQELPVLDTQTVNSTLRILSSCDSESSSDSDSDININSEKSDKTNLKGEKIDEPKNQNNDVSKDTTSGLSVNKKIDLAKPGTSNSTNNEFDWSCELPDFNISPFIRTLNSTSSASSSSGSSSSDSDSDSDSDLDSGPPSDSLSNSNSRFSLGSSNKASSSRPSTTVNRFPSNSNNVKMPVKLLSDANSGFFSDSADEEMLNIHDYVNDAVKSEYEAKFDPSLVYKPTIGHSTRDLGKKALATFRQEQTLTVDRLQDLHGSLVSRPTEANVAEDPAGLVTSLMIHQKQALSWLLWREKRKPPGGILADEMGLGKTLSMISLVLAERRVLDKEKDEKLEEKRYYNHLRYKGGTLVVCPASLLAQWENEVLSHCEDNTLTVQIYHGTNRIPAMKLCKIDIVITTYSVLSSSHDISYNSSDLYRVQWDRVILDEAHYIRNHKTKRCEAVCGLVANKRWALTGTPIHNKQMDLYAILKFLQCSPFDDLRVWKRWVDNKDQAGCQRLATLMKTLLLRRTKKELIQKGQIRPLPEKTIELVPVELDSDERLVYDKVMMYSRTIFRQFLDQRASKKHMFEAGASYRFREFNSTQNYLLAQHADVQAYEILVLLLRLRQICCHPSLIHSMLDQENMQQDGIEASSSVSLSLLEQIGKFSLEEKKKTDNDGDKDDDDDEIGVSQRVTENLLTSENPVFEVERTSSKLRIILQRVRNIIENTEDKIIIVSQWTQYLNIIADNLNNIDGATYKFFTGKVPVKSRNAIVTAFNKVGKDPRVLLLSLTAGGVGLNLIGANHLMLIDIHWNPQLENQAQDRIYRFGQTKEVRIHKFICTDTIEERIKSLQDKKMKIAHDLLTGTINVSTKLTLDDLKSLFSL